MLKKLLLLVAILSFAACSSKEKKPVENNFTIEDHAKDNQNQEDYQTLENANAAEEINKQTQAQIEEVEVQDRVYFVLNSSDINDAAKKVLDNQVSWLKSDPSINIIVEGHCDERGSREYNIGLGDRRANAVKNYLASGGIDAARIKTISYGKERPAFLGSSEEIWAKNRRAVTVVEQ